MNGTVSELFCDGGIIFSGIHEINPNSIPMPSQLDCSHQTGSFFELYFIFLSASTLDDKK